MDYLNVICNIDNKYLQTSCLTFAYSQYYGKKDKGIYQYFEIFRPSTKATNIMWPLSNKIRGSEARPEIGCCIYQSIY